ncbi:MAG: hypothetical protein CM1200mP29_04620 [Verrucomicrobiota bacterium]|nr:MAG: hypothetical protein CM1200mP29_04620 [Verrucomicrobiota bacterium]
MYAFNNLVTTNEEDLKLDAIEADMRDRVDTDSEGDGLEIMMVGIKRLGIPESVTGAVFERMKASVRLEFRRLRLKASAKPRRSRPRPTLKPTRYSRGRGQAFQIRGEAEAQAAKYFEVFKKNPELANFLFNQKAWRDCSGQPTLILDPKTPLSTY